ncbi:urease [Croceicoccus estronivorus]|uniref:HupE/UreJ family protein n=1 Tax=Croceicoccus estronivorus TaxID=1172626 RepID=UPI00082ADA5C|nr:HupE/UreJ family protein [Croceicoccus estronivorus]OCC22388.1 urease [Croceicoccus estronivorus]
MKHLPSRLAALAVGLFPASAMAHPGHDGAHGFANGIMHPLTGIDHLLAMLFVGLGAALFVKRRGWLIPATFLASLVVGFLTAGYISGSLVEATILVSLIALGLATAFRLEAPVQLAILPVAAFGYAHGAAHGIEMPQGAAPALFAAGFFLSSAILHAGGYWLSRILPLPALRIFGAAGAGMGLLLAGLG